MASICIDGFNLALPKGSGIATYGRNLATAFDAIGHAPTVLYGPAADVSSENLANLAGIVDGPPPKSRVNKNQRWRRTLLSRFGKSAIPVEPSEHVIWPAGNPPPVAGRFWSSQDLFTLSNRAFQKYRTITPLTFKATSDAPPPAVMHWTCPLPIHARDMINVVTIHDLIPLRLPYTTVGDTTAYLSLCKTAVERADHVIVVSEQTRRDVIELLGVDASKVTNTYQSVSAPADVAKRSPAEALADIEEILGLGWRGYFLYFGAVEPKKNLARTIEAHLTSGVSAPLVIVGGRGWLDDDENALLDQLGREAPDRAARVRRFPYMPYSLLLSVIRCARGVVFPSLYEGFGLPVLEAMVLGVPVITSTAGSLPEIAGDAAVSVDPFDVTAIRDAIRKVDADEGLREEMILKGRDQAAKFSPEIYQSRLADMFTRLGYGNS